MGKRAATAAAAGLEKKEEKKKKLAAEATAPAPAATKKYADDDDTPFPRGGASAITPLERREARFDAQRDFAIEQDAAARKKKSKKRDAEQVEEEEDVVMGALTAGDEIARAASLRSADLTVGLRLLGAVGEVSSSKLTIQLPCQLVGTVSPSDVSDELHAAISSGELENPPDLRKLFRVGEVLLCAVAAKPEAPSAPGRRSTPARLSLRLSLSQAGALRANSSLGAGALVWASVESEQEYGWLMRTGAGAPAFLHRNQWAAEAAAGGAAAAPAAGKKGKVAPAAPVAPPKLGRPILCTTAAAAKPKQPLQLRGLALAPPRPMPGSEAIAIEEMVPGMLFGAKVSLTHPNPVPNPDPAPR